MVEFPEVAIGATGRDFLLFANGEGSVLEEFPVLDAHVEGVGLEPGSANGGIPGGEELRDLMLGDS
jgi:hypothetical protein